MLRTSINQNKSFNRLQKDILQIEGKTIFINPFLYGRRFDKPTNILSFPARFDEDEKIFLGDLVLSYEIIHKEIKETNVSFENYISHLIVHGILHLLGYEHNTEENATYMENSEIAILSKFGIPNPYI